jgi:phosphomannomutase
MQDNTEARIKQDLFVEIQNLEQNYAVIRSFLGGEDYDNIILGQTIQSFKDGLSRTSAFVLALYNLKGKRVSIPWELLFTSLDYALATISVSSSPKQKEAVKTVLSMSQEQIQQVLSYFSALKESIK